MDFEPWYNNSASDEICPSCGIHYGYDDLAGGDYGKRKLIYKEWRNEWIKKGMPWNSLGIKKPSNWNPLKQLEVFYE